MSDLIERLRNFEGSDALGNGDFSLLHEAAAALEAARCGKCRGTGEVCTGTIDGTPELFDCDRCGGTGNSLAQQPEIGEEIMVNAAHGDIKLPPLPPMHIVPSVEPVDYPEVAQALMDYARAAVLADREALRAEVAEWKRVAAAQAELHSEAEERAERLAEALRECAENREGLAYESELRAEPAVWVAADTLNSPHPMCISSLAYMSQIDRARGREYVPLYTAMSKEALRKLEEHEQGDEALLRQALEALERGAWDTLSGRNAAFAIRERLGLGQENSND